MRSQFRGYSEALSWVLVWVSQSRGSSWGSGPRSRKWYVEHSDKGRGLGDCEPSESPFFYNPPTVASTEVNYRAPQTGEHWGPPYSLMDGVHLVPMWEVYLSGNTESLWAVSPNFFVKGRCLCYCERRCLKWSGSENMLYSF